MTRILRGDDVFESGCDLVDVTSLHRPDPSWVVVDAQGHEHRWFTKGAPATGYDPVQRYELPTLTWVVDYVAFYDDGEPYDVGHYQCTQCGEHVQPRSTADTTTQYIPGLRWFAINDEPVSEEEFKRRLPRQ